MGGERTYVARLRSLRETKAKVGEGRLDRAIERIERDADMRNGGQGVGAGTAQAPLLGPTRATTIPVNGPTRKQYPVIGGVLDYFPDAIVAIAHVSFMGNEQHNPGQPLHWAREKSTDDIEAMGRHLVQRGGRDTDGERHTAKAAWRLLAVLQKEIEGEVEFKFGQNVVDEDTWKDLGRPGCDCNTTRPVICTFPMPCGCNICTPKGISAKVPR